jgi:hypothetical protein
MDGHLYVNTATGIADVLNFTTTTPTLQPVVTPALAGAVGDGAACLTAANPFLNAQADDFSGTPLFAGVGGSAGNVYSNDTLNGAAFTPSSVTPAVLADGGLGAAISTDGTLSVPTTAAAGTYAVTYRICQTAAGRTGVCDTATATVAIRALPAVNAVADDFTANAITAGTATTAGNVLANDTIDGTPVTPAEVTATITDNGGLSGVTLPSTGDLTVPATATAGTHTVTYQICATAAPTACDTATALLRVAAVQIPPAGQGGPGTGAAAGSVTNEPDGILASTGFNSAAATPWAATAILLTLAGAALVLLRRRKSA